MTPDDRRPRVEWQDYDDHYDDPAALPCGCGPGVLNVMDEPGDADYRCPDCGETYTREEVEDK